MNESENLFTLLRNKQLRPDKKFGQNFLRDEEIINKLVSTGSLEKNDTVIEIGAGLGTVTKRIAPQIARLYAYEIDVNLLPVLRENIASHANIAIMPRDILDFNAQELGLADKKYKAIGSIPYQITSPLIHKLLAQPIKPSLVVLLIQKEVAEKICARVPNATYLSTYVSLFGKAEIVKIVKPSSFIPSPSVDSAIIRITLHPSISVEAIKWQKFLHHGFMQPRKMLNKRFDKDVLMKAGVDPNRRAQTVTFEEWKKLYNSVTAHE